MSTSERGDKVLGEDVFPTPTAWVMGNEEKGVSEMILGTVMLALGCQHLLISLV